MHDPNLLVGFDTNDDACVYRIGDDLALVQTVDFFPPVVDDPYQFGQIAAANALSDIYAMGAKPTLAMNLLCYPSCLPPETIQAILAGGSDKVAEAGAVLAGGHTIQDAEPKYGLCVSGLVHPQQILTNAGAQVGDLLLLTKPIGTGVLTTAAKADLLSLAQLAPAITSMSTLNRYAAEAFTDYPVHACTDVTGFGLLGHACEMAQASGVSFRLQTHTIPLFASAQQFAEMGILTAGGYENSAFLADKVSFLPTVSRVQQDLLFDPQTSGGLLIAVAASRVQPLLEQLWEHYPAACIIGSVIEQQKTSILVE